MNIRFLAPCLDDVAAKARLIQFGKTMCPLSLELFDANRQMVALTQVNYILLDERAVGPD